MDTAVFFIFVGLGLAFPVIFLQIAQVVGHFMDPYYFFMP